ncbi:HAD family hydrolase [Pseudooceanicola nitratireducens]|uniref:HAD family hydrolase n=1 Tax=Pseudooceanicola nitratireducens TaxID=517719 RepID=UPI003108DC93
MICFDFDGVIADSLPLWEKSCRQAAAEQGLTLPPEMRPFSRLDPLTFVQLAQDLGLHPQTFNNRMAELAQAHASDIAVFPAMAEVLAQLASRHSLAVISASRSAFIERFLSAHGLSVLFSEILGGDRHQGKAAALLSLPSPRAMIGDAKSDIDAARKAGVASIAVTWGWQGPEMLAKANYVVQTPEALPGIIDSMFGQA